MPKIVQRKNKRRLKWISRCEVSSHRSRPWPRPASRPFRSHLLRGLRDIRPSWSKRAHRSNPPKRHLLRQSRNDGELPMRYYRSLILFSKCDY